MTLSDQSVSKCKSFIIRSAEVYEDLLDERMKEDSTEESRANMGMMLAVIAISQAIHAFGVFGAAKKTIRAFRAGMVLAKSLRGTLGA